MTLKLANHAFRQVSFQFRRLVNFQNKDFWVVKSSILFHRHGGGASLNPRLPILTFADTPLPAAPGDKEMNKGYNLRSPKSDSPVKPRFSNSSVGDTSRQGPESQTGYITLTLVREKESAIKEKEIESQSRRR